MGQFMGNQAPSLVRLWRKPARTEHHILSHRVGMGVHISRRLFSDGTRMHTDSGKVVAEARLHKGASRQVERLTG